MTGYRIWLSRRRNGNFLLTKLRPTKHEVRGLGVEDYYVPLGDPMGLDNCCPAGVFAIFGVDLAIGEQCRAQMQGERIEDEAESPAEKLWPSAETWRKGEDK